MPKFCPRLSPRFYLIAALVISVASVSASCSSGEGVPQDAITPPAAEPAPAIIKVTRSGNPDGRTVFLVPGLASSAKVWAGTETHLAADYDVRTVQVAGFAGADPVSVDRLYTDGVADALVDELQAHSTKDAVLVGHSMGGFVSLKAALKAPELVDELVIVDSVPFLAGLFFPGATPESAAAQAPVMAAQMAAMPRAAFDTQQKQGLVRLTNTPDFLPTLEDWGRVSDQGVVAAITGEMLAADLRADLAALDTEALIMVPYDEVMGGTLGQVRSVYEAQYAAAPNTQIAMIEDSLHFIMIDQPEAFYTRLQAALAD